MSILTTMRLPSGRNISVMEVPLACCALEVLALRSELTPSEDEPVEVVALFSGTLTYALEEALLSSHRAFLAYRPELPHRIVAVGACATSGGPYWDSPTVIQGLTELGIEVDLYLPGCPPTPAVILAGLESLNVAR